MTSGAHSRFSHPAVLAAILALLAVIALAQSWNRWLDPIIDTGRDLYVTDQLTHGTKLYRDIRYQYPPLVPYAMAGMTALIGTSLAAFTAIGIAQSMAIALLLWVALQRIAGFAAAALFVTLSLAGASTWGANFVFPYAYAATIGMLFFVGALAGFVKERHGVAIALLVAASWCKIEYAFGAALVVAVLTIARRLRIPMAIGYVLAMVTSAAIAVAYFGPALRANVFAPSLTKGAIAQHFFRNVSGFADWPHTLSFALASAAAVALIAWLLRIESKLAVPAMILAAILFNSDAFFRGWAILQFVALLFALRERDTPMIYFAIFSIASTTRVALSVSPQWYGFALVVPTFALTAYVFFVSRFRSMWWLAIIVAICGRDLFEQHQRWALKQYPIVSSRGTFYDANADRAQILNELMRSVHGPTLSVMPEGTTINYFTRLPTPLTFHMFTPPETADPSVERAVLMELKSRRPVEIVVVSRDVSEYGFRGFGVDYDREIFAYALQNYRVERSWALPRFHAVLLRGR